MIQMNTAGTASVTRTPATKNPAAWRHGLAALLCCTALTGGLAALLAAPAQAQTANQPANQPVLNIPAQSLDTALVAFSRQTGIQVVARGADTAGRQSAAVSGPLTADAALARLLSGSGLVFGYTNTNTITVSRASDASQSQAGTGGETALGTIYLYGAESTWGPLSGLVAERTGTGSRTDAAVIDIPASVSVVGSSEMEARGVRSLDSALNYSAGVMTNLYGGDHRYDFFAIRGFDQTGAGAYRDGLQTRVYALTGSRVEPYGMERIEVLRGSTSTLYGTNRPGGMVNMITKRPLSYRHGEVFTRMGQDHLEVGADFGGPIDAAGDWSYRFTMLHQDATLPNGVSSDDRAFIAPALTWRPTDSTSLTLMAEYNDRQGANRYGIPLNSGIDPWTFLGEPDFETNDTLERSIGYAFEHQFGNGLLLRSHGRYTELSLLSENVYAAGNRSPEVGRLTWRVDGNLRRFSTDTHLQYDTSFGNMESRTLIGADYTSTSSFDEVMQGTAGGVGSLTDPIYCGRACITLRPYYSAGVEEETWGVYLQEELTINERWIATLGLRYDNIAADITQYQFGFAFPQQIREEALTSRIGLTWRASDDLSIYGTYSESFTPVLPTSTLFSFLNDPEPMMGEMFELGVKYRPAGMNALFTAALFDIAQTNVPYQTGTSGWTPIIEQIGEVRSRGLELEARAELTDRLSLAAAYTYTDAQVVRSESGLYDGNRPFAIPEHMGSIWAHYTFPATDRFGEFGFGLGARYVGSRFADQANSLLLDSFWVVDASVDYQVAENTSLSLGIENLFDREYVNHVETWSNPDTAFYGNPRSLRLTLRRTW